MLVVLARAVALMSLWTTPSMAAPPCGRSLTIAAIVQRGPTCAVAAVAMAARGLGAAIDLDELTRAIPVWRDGVSFFDLEDELARRGLRSHTFRGDAALAARFVDAGVPVVVAVDLHGGKHALTLAAYEGTRSGGRCAPARLRGIDPWLGRPFELTPQGLEKIQFGRQLFVLWPREAGWEERIAAAGIDLAPLVAEDRRFRAEELVLRAKQHPSPNAQMLSLLERAVAEDPTWADARALRDAVRRALAP